MILFALTTSLLLAPPLITGEEEAIKVQVEIVKAVARSEMRMSSNRLFRCTYWVIQNTYRMNLNQVESVELCEAVLRMLLEAERILEALGDRQLTRNQMMELDLQTYQIWARRDMVEARIQELMARSEVREAA